MLTHTGTLMCSDRHRVILVLAPSQKETVFSLSLVSTHNHHSLISLPSCGNHDHFPCVLKKPCAQNRCVYLMCLCFSVFSDHILEPWQRKGATKIPRRWTRTTFNLMEEAGTLLVSSPSRGGIAFGKTLPIMPPPVESGCFQKWTQTHQSCHLACTGEVSDSSSMCYLWPRQRPMC